MRYRATASGLLRIGLWTVFSLWLLGVLLPSGDAVPSDAPFADRVDARVSPIALAPSDPRAFLSDLDAQDGKAV